MLLGENSGYKKCTWQSCTSYPQIIHTCLPLSSQAPQELVSLFSGSRQVVYGFVPHCTMATLKARIGNKHVETMVSTADLGKTQGKVRGRPLLETNWFHCTHFTDATSVDSSCDHQRLDRGLLEHWSNTAWGMCGHWWCLPVNYMYSITMSRSRLVIIAC